MMIAIGAILIVEGVMNLCTGVYAAARLRACLKEHPEVLDGETQRPTIEGDAPAVDVEFRDVSSTDPQDKPENKPECLNTSRRRRIQKDAGVKIEDVNRLIRQFDQTRKMMKLMTDKSKMAQMASMMGKMR